jgi:ADP-dependent NAD(P)H-hydrate dehydratase
MSSPARAEPRTVTPALLRGWPLPPPGQDKHARGSVLVVGGAARSPGAVLLAGVAALRTGAGRLQLGVAATAAPALSVAVPEALVVPLVEADGGRVDPCCADDLVDLVGAADVLCVGPGLDDADLATALVERLLPMLGERTLVVLDAYALGALPRLDGAAAVLRGRTVLTPNSGETAVLLGLDEAPPDDALDEVAREISDRFGVVVTARGHVAAPEGGAWADGSGSAGLGTSGSGDVLAGTVAGLLARGATPDQAAVWGGHVHATAGERLAARVGPLGYLARELLDEAPAVLTELSVG